MIHKRWLLTAILLTATHVTMAQGLTVELDGPETASPGTLIVLDSSAIPASGRSWQVIGAPEGSYRVVDNGERLVFATARPGVYHFVFVFVGGSDDLRSELDALQELVIAAAASSEIEDIKVAAQLLSEITKRVVEYNAVPQSITHRVTVEGKLPDVDPVDPEPTPLPDGQYKLAMLSRAEALKVKDRSQSDVLAGVYRSVAAQIQAGALKGSESILSETGRKMLDRLGDDYGGFKAWGLTIMGRLSDLYESKELNADEDFATAYAEIALGLESLR